MERVVTASDDVVFRARAALERALPRPPWHELVPELVAEVERLREALTTQGGLQVGGRCPDCGQRIRPGDLAFVRGAFVHGRCPDERGVQVGDRRQQAMFAVRSVADLFFADMGFGCMEHADELAARVADRLEREGRLS